MLHAIIAVSSPTPRLVTQLHRVLGADVPLAAYAVSAVGRPALAGYPVPTRAEAGCSAGLLELLGGIESDAAVLVLHDDAELTDAALLALVDGYQRLGTPVLAGTEPAPVDRALPPGPRALVCGIAPVRRWRELAGRGGLHPLAEVELPGWVQPLDAELRHPHRCAAVLAGAPASRIVASMIVRDEAALVGGAVRSALTVCDEVVVYDTGSSDDTCARAEAAGARVVRGRWADDFATARNEALAAIDPPADWVLYLDADERLVGDCRDFRRHLDQLRGEWPGAQLVIRNVALAGVDPRGEPVPGAELSRFTAPRVIDPSVLHFEGRLHELPVPPDGRPVALPTVEGAMLLHYGYDPSFLATRDKHQRNLTLARRQYEQHPDPTTAVHLLRSLAATQTVTVAELAAVPVPLDALPAPEAALVLRIRGEALLREGRVLEARATLAAALARCEDFTVAHGLAGLTTPRELLALWAARGPASARTVQIPAHRGVVQRAELAVRLEDGDRPAALALLTAGVAAPVFELLAAQPEPFELLAVHAEHCPEPGYRIRARLATERVEDALADTLVGAALPDTEAGYTVLAALDADEVLVGLLGSPSGGQLVELAAPLLSTTELAHVALVPLALGTGNAGCVVLGLRAALAAGGRPMAELYRPYLSLLGPEAAARLAALLDG